MICGMPKFDAAEVMVIWWIWFALCSQKEGKEGKEGKGGRAGKLCIVQIEHCVEHSSAMKCAK
jgi:hypothetical protein